MNRLQLGVGVLAALFAVACSSGTETGDGRGGPTVVSDATFPTAGVRVDDHRRLGAPVVIDALTVWPVHTDAPVDVGEFLTLHEAQTKGFAQLREQGAASPTEDLSTDGSGEDSASVGTLELENTGDLPILVLAGTIVKGGKQDRQIGQDFVIKPKSTVPVDAFCVENGRWDATREGQSTGGIFKAQSVVATQGVRLNGQYIQDQSKVWEEVGVANSTASKAPATSTLMATIEDSDGEAVAYRELVEAAIRTRFEAAKAETQAGTLVGYAYALEGKLVGLRAFAHPKLFAKQWDACLKSICIEGDLTRQRLAASGVTTDASPAPAAQVSEFVKAVKATKAKARTAGHNVNRYRLNEKGGNAVCEIETEDGGTQTLTEDFLVR
jgi:hypothetical protein